MKRFLVTLLTILTVVALIAIVYLGFSADLKVKAGEEASYTGIITFAFVAFFLGLARFLVASIKIEKVDLSAEDKSDEDKYVKVGDKLVELKNVNIMHINTSDPDDAVVEINKEPEDL